MTVSDLAVLREQLQEDTLQVLLKYITNRVGIVVTPEDFGAVGDGVHDDLPAFQLAGEALKRAGGGDLNCTFGKIYRLTDEWVYGYKTVSTDGIKCQRGYAYTSHPSYSAANLALARGVPYININGNGATIWADWDSTTGKAAIYYGVAASDGKINAYNGSVNKLTIIGKEGMTGSPPGLAGISGSSAFPASNHQVGIAAILCPIKIDQVFVREMEKGIATSDCYWAEYSNSQVQHCRDGFVLVQSNACSTKNLLAISCRRYGYDVTCQQANYRDLHTENAKYNFRCVAADIISVSHCYWEGTYAGDTDYSVLVGDSSDPATNHVIGLKLADIHLFQQFGKGILFHSAPYVHLDEVRSYNLDSKLNNANCYVHVTGYPTEYDSAGSHASAQWTVATAGALWHPSEFGEGDRSGFTARAGDMTFNKDRAALSVHNGVTWDEPTVDGSVTASQYGAQGIDSGGVDDTAELAAAINYAGIRGNVLRIKPGTYRISSTLYIQDKSGFEMIGHGNVLLKWVGASGSPMVVVKNCQYTKIRGINMQGNTSGGNRPSCFLQSLSDDSYARTYNPTGLEIEDCVWGTGSADEATDGLVYAKATVTSDTNNSEGYHKNLLIRGVTAKGVSIEHSQSKAHKFIGGGVVGAQYGIYCDYGSFSTDEFAVSNCSVANYHLGNPNDPIEIKRMTSEGSARFITTGGPAAAGFLCSVIAGRFATNGLHADNKAIIYQFPGLSLIGTNFDSGGNPALIELTNAAGCGFHNIIGCMWNSPNSHLQTPIVIGSNDILLNMEGCGFSDAVGAMIAQKHSGQVTVSGAATTGSVTFAIPEFLVGGVATYNLRLTPVTVSAAASAGSSRVRSIAKTATGFTVTVEAAPGVGESVTFDWDLTRK